MHVGKGVQVLVLIHLLGIGLGMRVTRGLVGLRLVDGWVHQHNLSLELLVVSLEGFLLTESFLDGHDEFSAQLLLLVKVGDLVNAIAIIIIVKVSIVVLSA
jgi:hypothetical protein